MKALERRDGKLIFNDWSDQVGQEATNHDSNDDEQTYQWVTYMGDIYGRFWLNLLWPFHYDEN